MSFAKAAGGVRDPERDRSENDHYPTPPFVVHALVCNHSIPTRVWEPAAGRGWMAWELQRSGYAVHKSDLFEYPDPVVPDIRSGVDFTQKTEPHAAYDAVVTNPPYARDLAQKFVERAYEDHDVVAMLCRLQFAEGKRRYPMFTDGCVPSNVYIFSGRFSCEEKRFLLKPSGMIAYAWWVWDKRLGETYPGETRVSWLDTDAEHESWLKSMSPDDIEYMKGKIRA